MRAKSAKAKAAAKPKTIDDYLAPLDADQRGALEKLRKTIRAAAPGVEECISYGMPGFRYDGRMLVWFGAAASHCAFYPGGVVPAYEKELKDFETSKGTIRFQPDHALPAALIRKIVKERIAGNKRRGA
ncbi:MAG TPA: DUF1801 domain-containing protein [Vicinamibacterales bacterium]|nr:DUF1801 domain-containing protein [Vicinamibacterales bacterium]